MDNYYYKKLKYEYKLKYIHKNQLGGSLFAKFHLPQFFPEKKLPILKSQRLVDISASQIDDITTNDYYNLFED
jgi:hypothetical protein